MNLIKEYVFENKPLSYAKVLIFIAVILENIGLALPFYLKKGFFNSVKAVASSYIVQGNWSIIILLSSFVIVYALLSRNDIMLLISAAINMRYIHKCFRAFSSRTWMIFSFFEYLSSGARYLYIAKIILTIGIISYAILRYFLKFDFKNNSLIDKDKVKEKIKNFIADFKNSSMEKRALYIFALILIISVFTTFKQLKLLSLNVKVPAFGVSVIGAYLTVIFGIYIINSLLENNYSKLKFALIAEILIKVLFFRRGQVLERDLSTGEWTNLVTGLGYNLYTIAIVACVVAIIFNLIKRKSNT